MIHDDRVGDDAHARARARGMVADPWGNVWQIATHKELVPPEEMQKRAAAAMKS